MRKEYTPMRQIYAWVGFGTIATGFLYLAIKLIMWHEWAIAFISA